MLELKEEKSASLYIHIPFCRSKCAYCDFNSYAPEEIPEERYVDCIIREFDYYHKKCFFKSAIESVYLGGGNPSLLSIGSIARIMEHIQGVFKALEDAEVTIEANPTSVDRAKLEGYLNKGINRLSLGVQSFSDFELKRLGREHDSKEALNSFHLAREAGFANLGIDLIYGVPGQTLLSFRASLECAIELAPEHISLYGLTYEEGTPIFTALEAGVVKRVGEKSERDMYLLAMKLLKDAGYVHYEVSNFALPGRESNHNSAYWQRSAYIGIGAGAHSCSFGDNTERWWNEKGVDAYMRSVEERGFARAGGETLTRGEEKLEAVYLGLRVLDGIDTKAFRARFSSDPMELLSEAAMENELLTMDDRGVLKLTQKGLIFSDSLF